MGAILLNLIPKLLPSSYREAMVGNISLYDVTGKRLYTVYIGEAPEYGKGTFFQRLEQEIATVKKLYPDALYLAHI